MGATGCPEAMELLNQVFGSGLIFNDGHEIFARLTAGDEVVDIVEDLGLKFGSEDAARPIRNVIENWPSQHLEAVGEMVRWALGKLDSEDRVTIAWKGNADHPETVTRFELRDHSLLIEFAHPPAAVQAVNASSGR